MRRVRREREAMQVNLMEGRVEKTLTQPPLAKGGNPGDEKGERGEIDGMSDERREGKGGLLERRKAATVQFKSRSLVILFKDTVGLKDLASTLIRTKNKKKLLERVKGGEEGA
jgi:hypothetical protein